MGDRHARRHQHALQRHHAIHASSRCAGWHLTAAWCSAPQSAGDSFLPIAAIEVHVAELKQLFNAIDPSPFRERIWTRTRRNSSSTGRAIFSRRAAGVARVLDRTAGWARSLLFCGTPSESSSNSALGHRDALASVASGGRTSLVIGLAFLAVSFLVGDVSARCWVREDRRTAARKPSHRGWVAMWRPRRSFSMTGGRFARRPGSSTV